MTKPTLDYQPKKVRRPRRRYVWRALAYLRPYRRLVVISIACALFAGGVFFSGLGAILPVLQTLLNGDTPRAWVDRMVAEARWGIDLDDEPGDPNVVRIDDDSPMRSWMAATHARRSDIPVAMVIERGGGDENNLEPDEALRRLASRETIEMGELVSRQLSGQHGGIVTADPTPLHLRLLRRGVYLLPPSPVGAVAALMFGVFLLSALANLVRYFQEFLSNKAALLAVNDLRSDLYGRALRAPLSYFGRVGTGDVTSRIIADCGQMQEGFRTLLGRAVMEPVLAGFALAFALWLDWRLTLFVIAFAPVMAVVLKKFGTKMRRASRATLQESGELLGQINATLAGVRVVKAHNAEAHEQRRLGGVLGRLLGVQLRLTKYDAMSTPVMETLAVLAVGVVVTLAVYLVRVDGTLDAASAILVFGCLTQVAESLRRVSKLNIVLSKANAAGERIFEALDLPAEGERTQRREGAKRDAKEREGAEAEPKSPSPAFASVFAPSRLCDLRLEREVTFDRVTFRYSPDQPPALDGVSLAVRKGESLAVVGRNGSGKTTLLSLLPRFYDPDDGRVTIDGRDVRDLPLDGLRSLIGVVTQDAVVFPGTVAENIAYAMPTATREEIERAAHQAEAHEFILAKPGGYDFPLTGLGGQLSGGQRQRLSIARAILRDPPVLILDEATSQVDAESEGLIQQAVRRLMRGRTTFVIAHRFSTILDCDRIALMDAGRLVAVGPHAELIDRSPLYRTLYDRQVVAA